MKTKKKSKSEKVNKKRSKASESIERVSAADWVRDNDPMREDKLTWLDAEPYSCVMTKGHEWNTVCGRYRIKRAIQKYGGDQKHSDYYAVEYRDSVAQHGGGIAEFWNAIYSQGSYVKHFKLLHTAIEAAEALHCERFNRKSVESNVEEIVAMAKKRNLHELQSFVSNRFSGGSAGVVSAASGSTVQTNGRSSVPGSGGSIKERLFAAIDKTPRTMQELLKIAGILSNQSGYLNKWAKEGVVRKEGNTYARV